MGIRAQGNPLASFLDVWSRSGTDASGTAGTVLEGLTATGGIISDYTSGSDVYRAHIFTSSGSFVVTDGTSDFPLAAKVLVIAGGGGGGGGPNWAGGGGAGGLLEASSFTLAQRTYPIVIGGGGAGGINNTTRGQDGGDTIFTDPGGPTTYTATGGGGGGAGSSPRTGRDGGSGGGGGENTSGGSASQPSQSPFTGYANVGGGSGGGNNGSGGGGAGNTATPIPAKYPGTIYVDGTTPATQPSPGTVGGDGRANTFAYGPTNPQVYGGGGGCGYFDWDGPGGPNLGSGVLNPTNSVTDMNTAPANGGGGGKGGAYYQGVPLGERHGTSGTGGGGGGGVQNTPRTPSHPQAPQPAVGGTGGGGIVVVGYQIGSLTATAKATGGAISYYSGKTIHTFTSSGDFNVTSGPVSANYLVVAGGGGGSAGGGGGGAGGMLDSTVTIDPGPYSVTVGGGGSVDNVGPPAHESAGFIGYNSVLNLPSAVTATGGGGGAIGRPGGNTNGPKNGGSGGGGGESDTSGGTGISGQGYPGGAYAPTPHWSGGGGGGAGGAGAAPTVPAAGVGGVGAAVSWIEAGGTPGPSPGRWFAGGGAGSTEAYPNTPIHGTGGSGGGGGTEVAGTVNTGGGGGGGFYSGYPSGKGAKMGGSGIVIVAYPS